MEIVIWIVAALAALFALGIGWAAFRTERSAGAAEASVPATGSHVLARNRSVAAKIHYVDVAPEPAGHAPRTLRWTAGATEEPTPIALVHGLGGTTRHFTSTIMPALAAKRRVVALDRPGYGYSDRPLTGAATLSEQAALLRDALEKLGIERAIWVGHSFGGAVALAAALDAPGSVAGLALLAPAVFPSAARPPFDRPPVEAPFLQALMARTFAVPAAEAAGAEVVRAVFAPQEPPEDYDEAGGGKLAYRPGQSFAAIQDFAVIQGCLSRQSRRYAALGMPVSVLFGSDDAILRPSEHGPALQRVAEDVSVSELEGVGHMLPFAAPQACVEEIERLADRVAARHTA